ncbi:diguanylate cyclase [Aggregicoccus sp. 17bor-14]|nr:MULTISPECIES: diguanylate cyclase [Myxococcaceae]MBF5042747.1 diguanylate cyclase [Simulacricoccus sp. 17bor-14]MRI88515.1 diguanylate cyclase [Aggregicoccus sp. 17bor-14]
MPGAVLIVDDSRAAQEGLAAVLAGAGVGTRSAADGAEALRLASAGAGVDLVILDLGLPGMDGLQVLRMLRASERLRHVPVLVLTARGDRETRLAALRLGADDFLPKPWDAEALLARVERCLETKRRIDALTAQAAELQKLSTTDGLTQVHNHRHFQERLREEFRRAQRYGDPLSLILVDLDHFKAVNDRHGHLAGDRVLREVSGALRQSVRDTDLLARYGGEEFAVLLPHTSVGGSLTVAERILRDVGALAVALEAAAQPAGAPVPPLRVTASVGVSALPHRSIGSAEQLFRAADEALYRAKREGRNRVCLASQVSLLAEPPARAG